MWWLYILIILVVVFSLISVFEHYLVKNTVQYNQDIKVDQINKYSLPIIDDDKKYIELQTKEWIKKRNNQEPCYAVLEKDKVIMAKWMEILNVTGPKIYYHSYHDEFKFSDLERIVNEHGLTDKLIIKITHLQSNYGVKLIPRNPSQETLKRIYNECLDLFNTCFVCNHDSCDPPSNKEISKGKKESYYKLYETIKPGIIIQEFFYSSLDTRLNDKNDSATPTPTEIKILLFGNRIAGFSCNLYLQYRYFFNPKTFELLFDEAKRISTELGATFIRVDFLINEDEDIYKPYLNEISLSPVRGLTRAWVQTTEDLRKIKGEIQNAEYGNYKEIDELIENCPYRSKDLTIVKYLSDADCKNEKY